MEIYRRNSYCRMKNAVYGYIKLFAIIAASILYILIHKYCFRIVSVSGSSMADTVCDQGICFVTMGNADVERYDIVLARLQYKTVVKRVIGLPGDRVLIKDGTVYINGIRTEEFDIYTERPGEFFEEVALSENEFFLLGDNRAVSRDSRDFGTVSREKIMGEVTKILWVGKSK